MSAPAADRYRAVRIRRAQVEDAEALARCHLACWAETYRGRVDDEAALASVLAAVEQRVERWRSILAGAHATTVALDETSVLGFVSTGPQRDADLDLPLELYALYVRQARWGTGLGSRLFHGAVGDAASSLWVLGTNERARAFYTRHGYRTDGAEKHDDLFGTEVRMVRGIGPTAA